MPNRRLEHGLYRLEVASFEASTNQVENKRATRVIYLGEAIDYKRTNPHPQHFEDLTTGPQYIFLPYTKDVWHQRLGQPSSRILSQILRSCNLSVKSNENCDFYETCKYGQSHRLPLQVLHS